MKDSDPGENGFLGMETAKAQMSVTLWYVQRQQAVFLSLGPGVQGGQWQEMELKKWIRLVIWGLVISVHVLGLSPGGLCSRKSLKL